MSLITRKPHLFIYLFILLLFFFCICKHKEQINCQTRQYTVIKKCIFSRYPPEEYKNLSRFCGQFCGQPLASLSKSVNVYLMSLKLMSHTHEAAPVAEWLRSLTSVLLIIRSSHRCGFAPRSGHESHVGQAKFCRWFFPGYSGFCPTYRLIRLDMSEKA